MISICGRKVKVQTGTHSQTVNVCSVANVHGQYDYRVRLTPPFTSELALLNEGFQTIEQLVHYLCRHHSGNLEQSPSVAASSVQYPDSSTLAKRPTAVASQFMRWREAWDAIGDFRGADLPQPAQRVENLLRLWQAPIPGAWTRTQSDIPSRLLTGRYTRGNLNGSRRGEHQIEHDILMQDFDHTQCLGRQLLDGISAYPLVKDHGGGRCNDVEADLVLLVGPPASASILVSDVKVTDGNPWTALVQNIRQLRLFTANPECVHIFSRRGLQVKAAEVWGAVVAPESFYRSPGQKANSVRHALRLSEALRSRLGVRVELLVWARERCALEVCL